MACVKAGMGREAAHEVIKKHATTKSIDQFFSSLANEKDFPLTVAQLNDLVKNPADFAGDAISQSKEIAEQINKLTKGEITRVDLEDLI